MDAILQKFAGNIDAQSVVRTVEEIRVEYIDDGLTKEDIPPILGRFLTASRRDQDKRGRRRSATISHKVIFRCEFGHGLRHVWQHAWFVWHFCKHKQVFDKCLTNVCRGYLGGKKHTKLEKEARSEERETNIKKKRNSNVCLRPLGTAP